MSFMNSFLQSLNSTLIEILAVSEKAQLSVEIKLNFFNYTNLETNIFYMTFEYSSSFLAGRWTFSRINFFQMFAYDLICLIIIFSRMQKMAPT
jgi:hypothetical protein